jgi:hypothetical protein
MRADVFRSLVNDLAGKLGNAELSINAAQVCSLRVSESCWVHVSYSETQDAVHWTSVLCSMTGRDPVALYRYLLRCNLNGSLMQGGFFGLNELNEAVVYRYHEPLDCLHLQRFIAITESFSAAAVAWSQRLSDKVGRSEGNKRADADLEIGGSGNADLANALFNRA